jgi:predicted AAA+ superfamily ATPase
VLDEVQKIPALLDEVHRLIERRKLRFILTGSSARKLRRQGINLLAGRALTRYLFPLTCRELGGDFNLTRALKFGTLPEACTSEDPKAYLQAYIQTYLREEIQQEGLTRNLGAFARFLESASFSQGQTLNISSVARDCGVDRKVVEEYFSILDDLMIGVRLPNFSKRAKRRVVSHPKFYFFDTGVYRMLRPRGPLDATEDLDGPALETLVLQEMRALNSYLNWEYEIYSWRTHTRLEVDFILYGERGLKAIDVKRSDRVREEDLSGLKAFLEDYPAAQGYFVYGGTQKLFRDRLTILPLEEFLKSELMNF